MLPSTLHIQRVVLTYHLHSSEYANAKIDILTSLRGTLIDSPPAHLSREELAALGRFGLIQRFLYNNETLKAVCEEEARNFPRIYVISKLPSDALRERYSWTEWKKKLLAWTLRQTWIYEEQEEIKSVLKGQFNVTVVLEEE